MTVVRRLGPRGRAFWKAVQARFEFEPAEEELLVEVCRVLDTIEALQDQIAPKSAGSDANTALAALRELRSQRLLLGRMLAQLALPNAAGEAPLSLRSQRARRAANRRWELHRARHAS